MFSQLLNQACKHQLFALLTGNWDVQVKGMKITCYITKIKKIKTVLQCSNFCRCRSWLNFNINRFFIHNVDVCLQQSSPLLPQEPPHHDLGIPLHHRWSSASSYYGHSEWNSCGNRKCRDVAPAKMTRRNAWIFRQVQNLFGLLVSQDILEVLDSLTNFKST